MKFFLSVLITLSLPVMAFSSHEEAEISGVNPWTGEEIPVYQKSSVPRASFLLIPDSQADVVGMFSPFDGAYLGNIIVDDPTGINYDLSTPINAIQGPGNFIFLSDQVSDAVYAFDTLGNFLYVAADTSDGIDNVRGIDFRNDTLFVTCGATGSKAIYIFSGPHQFAGFFVPAGTIDPFDIFFLSDGSALVSDIEGSTDNVRLYNPSGTFVKQIISINFPEQINQDPVLPGEFLVAGFSANNITDFDTSGTVFRTLPFNGARGVYRLGNGNILATSSAGVVELDSLTGAQIAVKYTGQCRFIELYQTGMGVEEQIGQPTEIKTYRVFPNPFDGDLNVSFSLLSRQYVCVSVYSVLGSKVRTLSEGVLSPGEHSLKWNGRDDGGNDCVSGVYFITISTPEGEIKEKVDYLR
ncbi:T9SS type A sorting domain-containing protein [candidate division WOR-3 bacterium]|nr:T9SS type A sorting domain-containing protein [candidate division WOR-3 bacterium]